MSLYESDSALITQTNPPWLHTTPANLGKHSFCKISWHIYHREHVWNGGQHISDISLKSTNAGIGLSHLREY